jgi:hypothetical protein
MFPKLSAFDIIKLFFRTIFVLLVAAVFAVLFWRMATSRVPKELLELTPNDVLTEAYNEYGDELTLMTQEQNTITRTKENYGYFAVSEALFIPKANQLQLIIRYNDSTLEALQKDYGLDFLPKNDKDWYDVSIVVATDLTPENEDDNLSNDRESVALSRILPTTVSASMHKGRHNYRKLIFDGISFDDSLLAVYADFFYIEDIGYLSEDFDIYTDKAYGTLCLYAFTEEGDNQIIKLTEKQKHMLEE